MTENHKKNAGNLTKIIAQTTFIFAAGSVFFGGVNIQPASASTSCSVDGVRSVPGQRFDTRIGFRATGANPSSCESELTNGISKWCNSFELQGGAHCRGDWSTFKFSDNSTRPPRSSPTTSPSQVQPIRLRLALDSNAGSGNPYLYSAFNGSNPNHLWRVTPLSDDYFMITSRVNGAALDANGGNGSPYLNRNPDRGNPNHYWRLSEVGNYYMITSRVNGAALDANGGNGNLYLNRNPDRNNPNHLWKIVDIENYKAIGSALKN